MFRYWSAPGATRLIAAASGLSNTYGAGYNVLAAVYTMCCQIDLVTSAYAVVLCFINEAKITLIRHVPPQALTSSPGPQ